MTRIVIVPVIIERGAAGQFTARAGTPLPKTIESRVLEAAERTSGFAPAPEEPSDPLKGFLETCTEQGCGRFVCVADLYAAYKWWCGQNNDRYPLSREAVGELLQERGVRYSRGRRLDGKQCRTWEGIGLRPDAPLSATGPRQRLEDVKAKLRRALVALEAE